MVAGRGNRHVILGTIEFLILTSKTLQLPPRIPNRASICQYFLPLPHHSCSGTRIPTHGYLYASRLLITSLGSGLGPSRLGLTPARHCGRMVTSLGFWPQAQPTRTLVTSPGSRPPAQPTRTRTHGHVPRLRASGLADSDLFRLPAHAGPVRPRDAVDGQNMAPDHWPLDRWGDPTVSAWSCVPVEDAALPTPALGATRPPPRGSGSQRASTAEPVEPGPGPSRPPVLTPARLRPIVQGHPPPSGRYLENMVRTTWTPARLYASEPPHPG